MLDLSQQGRSFADRSDPGLGSDASAEEVSLKRPHWKNRHTLGTISGLLCNMGLQEVIVSWGLGHLEPKVGSWGSCFIRAGCLCKAIEKTVN